MRRAATFGTFMTRPEIPVCQLLILDLDNTLIREWDYLDAAYRAVAEMLAKEAGKEAIAVYARMRTMFDTEGRSRLFDKICDELLLEGRVQQCLEVLRKVRLAESMTLADWAGVSLREHAAQGGFAAVLTNGHPAQQMNKFSQVEWAGAPVPFLCLANELRPKPAPDGVEWLMRLYGVTPRDTVFVGDTDIDRGAAEASKVRFVKA